MAQIEQMIEEIKGMTVLELNELVKALEDEFGVSAAAAAPVSFMNLRRVIPLLVFNSIVYTPICSQPAKGRWPVALGQRFSQSQFFKSTAGFNRILSCRIGFFRLQRPWMTVSVPVALRRLRKVSL